MTEAISNADGASPRDAVLNSIEATEERGLFDPHLLESTYIALMNHRYWVLATIAGCLLFGLLAVRTASLVSAVWSVVLAVVAIIVIGLLSWGIYL